MLLAPFAIQRDGEPIELAPLKRTVKTGIAYGDARMDLGMVAEYEEREAAVHSGTPWLAWLDTTPIERAAMVAHLRLSRMIDLHANDAVMRDVDLRERRQRLAEAQAREN